jgi:hypothetical protein
MIDENWFKHHTTVVAYKRPASVCYEVAASEGVVETLEGPMRYPAGACIMTGPKGERYPITRSKFDELYDDHSMGTATPKKIFKSARLADHNGVIHTSWGDLTYSCGNDYIVRHGNNDYGVVKIEIFRETYEITH